jgi:peroxiredoxin
MAAATDFGIDFSTIGPAVGARFPDVMLPDQYGKTLNLHQVRAGRRALVVFHRSAANRF